MFIAVSEEPKAHLGHIADAFSVSSETLRQLRVLVSREGIEAVVRRKRGGSTGRGLTARVEGEGATLRPQPVSSARWVQHVGAWLMLALLERLGLYDAAGEACADADTRKQLRIALDAFVCALGLGEGCVEGVRRLMTPSGPALLRSNRAPSATWVRRVFGALAGEQSAARLHLAMARRYVREAHAETERDVVVFYVDNHLRPYTGKGTIGKGWRMQDKRVRPGVTDVYVHDEGGNPVLRLADATNGSLTTWLSTVAKLLREMVGPRRASCSASIAAEHSPSSSRRFATRASNW